jgi:hypothetical protein
VGNLPQPHHQPLIILLLLAQEVEVQEHPVTERVAAVVLVVSELPQDFL